MQVEYRQEKPSRTTAMAEASAAIHAKWEELEGQQRDRVETPSSEWLRLPSQLTAGRNRHGKAEPFARQRIKLKVFGGANDYINSSPIRLRTRRYIAAQGPRPNTISHFYRMLAEEAQDFSGAIVVVMLTRTHEDIPPREKCAEYFPIREEDSPWLIPVDLSFQDSFQGEVILRDVVEDVSTRSEVRCLRLRVSRT